MVLAEYDVMHSFNGAPPAPGSAIDQGKIEAIDRVIAVAPEDQKMSWQDIQAGYIALSDGTQEEDRPFMSASLQAALDLDTPLRAACGVGTP